MQTFLFDFRALELVTQKCWERKPTMNLIKLDLESIGSSLGID